MYHLWTSIYIIWLHIVYEISSYTRYIILHHVKCWVQLFVLSNYWPADSTGTATFYQPMIVSSSTTALTCELKPFDAPFLSTDDPRFSWLKQFTKYFEDWLTTVEVRPGVYEKFEKKCWYYHKHFQDIKSLYLELAYIKFSITHKVSDVLVERFSWVP